MRPADSCYDRSQALGTAQLLEALRGQGYDVRTYVTGTVEVEGGIIEPGEWDRMVANWDGTPEGVAELLGGAS